MTPVTPTRVVSWNCAGAYRRKHHAVDVIAPDLILLQEPSQADLTAIEASGSIWRGAETRKGIAAIASNPHELSLDGSYRNDLPWFLPLRFREMVILHCWACVIDHRRRYVRLLHEALDHYEAFLISAPAIVIGDLNSNARFDAKQSSRNHAEFVERLSTLGLVSLYHAQTGEAMGHETVATYFHLRNRDMPHMFDYAFVGRELHSRSRLAIGTPNTWFGPSDHMPLIVDIGAAQETVPGK